jgi:hypothetical protein
MVQKRALSGNTVGRVCNVPLDGRVANVPHFSVADDDTIEYDHSLDNILSGRGTSTLVIHGLPR